MHERYSTRAWISRRQRSAIFAAALAALFVPTPSLAASPAGDVEITGSIDRGAAHEVRIRQTAPGREGLELMARLAEDGGIITLPVAWSVRSLDGEVVYSEKTPVADLRTPPGDYLVAVAYGTVKFEQQVTLLEAQQLGVVFTLNVGGIRVLPRLKDLGLPSARSETAVYALSGTAKGKRVAVSSVPGEVIRVGSGAYRIETKFVPGNAVATADVVVTPGLMSAVEIDHAAGLARLSLATPPRGDTRWTITGADGKALPGITGSSTDIVLKPGAYDVEVVTDGHTETAGFSISAGEMQYVIVGN